MPIQAPNADHVKKIARSFGMSLTDADAASFAGLLKGVAASYDRLDAMVEPRPEVKYPRATGAQPAASENPYNAWSWRCTIKGAPRGILAGKKIAVKDNVCIAGLPMRNGSRVLENYVPDVERRSSPASSMPAGPSSARRYAKTFAFPAAAIRRSRRR
jgi:amidase